MSRPSGSVIGTPEKYWLHWKEADAYPEAGDNPLLRELSQLCSKTRLLEIIHHFMVFDAGIKKTCRHNQYFGVRAAQERGLCERIGVTDGLVRISVGIEAVDDLVADLERELGTIEETANRIRELRTKIDELRRQLGGTAVLGRHVEQRVIPKTGFSLSCSEDLAFPGPLANQWGWVVGVTQKHQHALKPSATPILLDTFEGA